MAVRFHPHALVRLVERGATEREVIATIECGERFAAKFGRVGFRRSFSADPTWQGRGFVAKQVEVYAADDDDDWLVITVIVKYSFSTEQGR